MAPSAGLTVFVAADILIALLVTISAFYISFVAKFAGEHALQNGLQIPFGLVLALLAFGRAFSCGARACAPCADARELPPTAILDRGLCYVGIGLFNSDAPEWVGPSFIAIAIVGLLYMLTSLLMSCQGYSVRQKAEKEKEARDMQQAIAMAHVLGPQGWSGPPSGWNGAPQQAYPAQKPPSTSPYSGYGHHSGGPPPYTGRASQSGWR